MTLVADPDRVVAGYTRDVDRTLPRESLERSVAERLGAPIELRRLAEELRRAGRRAAR